MIAASLGVVLAMQAPVTPPADAVCNKPVYMVVEGQTLDRERMLAYGRAIAESQIYQRLGGYYITVPQPIDVFEGELPPGYVNLTVRFPCLENARAFWNSDVYQNEIIKLRQNPSAGDYTVSVYPEMPLRDDMSGKVGDNSYLVHFEGTTIPAPIRFADPTDLVLGLDADEIEAKPYFNDLLLRTALRNSSDGSYAARVTFLSAEKMGSGPVGRDYQMYVLDGEMTLGEMTLGQGDFAHIPQGVDVGGISGTPGTTYLLFGAAKKTGPLPKGEAVFVRGADVEWRAGTVAAAGGAKAELQIKPLWTDPATGARAHLVSIAPGVSVPWEIHPSVEEGYLLEGDYKLAECLPSGRRDFDYGAGGYFYRPGGVMHSGPDSSTSKGATWLIRTPAELTALFYPSCPAAPASEENEP